LTYLTGDFDGLNFEIGFYQTMKIALTKTFPHTSRRSPQESRNAYQKGNASFTADCLSRTCLSVDDIQEPFNGRLG